MKLRKKKERLPILVVEKQRQQYSYKKFLWICIVTAIFLTGNILSFLSIFGEIKISKMIIILAAVAGMAIAVVTECFAQQLQWILGLRIVWIVFLFVFGPWTCWEGMRMWLNQIIIGWNQLQHGGMVLFAGDTTNYAAMAFGVLSAMIFGEITWIMLYRGKMSISCIYVVLWIFIMAAANRFNALSAAFLLSGLFGANMFKHSSQIRRSGLISFVVIFAVCMIGVFLTSDTKLYVIEETKENVGHTIHEIRYGKDQLPEGKLAQAAKLQSNDQEMMKITPEDKKTLYIKAFVGTVYKNGVWEQMPDSVYGGQNAGLMRWLKKKDFDPMKQSAQYQELTTPKNKLSKNHVRVQVKKASRYYFYVPDSLKKIINGEAKNKMDMNILSKGFFGQKQYEWTEISSTRPSELTVADEWVTHPKTSAQKQYSEAEAVYRQFVYENYTKADENHTKLINKIFWKDYHSKSDGIYSALNHVRMKLREQYKYTKSPQAAPEGEDEIRWFLETSHTGNQMLYASAAVEAFRVHGIPARYVEGYYLGVSRIDDSKTGTVSISGQNAHAWVEVYFDGVGWKAIDVTPGYYYNVATLQKMVNTPEQVKKNAALKNNGYKGKQTADSGKNDKNIKKMAKKTIKNLTILLLGAFSLVMILTVIVIVFIEVRFLVLEKIRITQYKTADMNQKIKILQKEIFGFLTILGIEARLGWNTKQIDKSLSDRYQEIQPGDYERASALIEKTIYGDIVLELFEERTIKVFRDKLFEIAQKRKFKEKIRFRYQYFKHCV